MGDKGVMAVGDDMGEGMQCSDHPYGNNLGGICALCLQEKLGKLLASNASSSTPFPPHPSSSSSSPSDYGSMGPPAAPSSVHKKKNSAAGGGGVKVTASAVLKRSKSVAPRPISDAPTTTGSPRKKSFWSFLYLSSSSSAAATSSSSNKLRRPSRDLKQQGPQSSSKVQTTNVSKEDHQEAVAADSPGGSQASSSSFGRKVARSRSVGCGSRSFSGDFLERISTGFGDCTLRRVESHRESIKHNSSSKMVLHRHDSDEQRIKERVKCGGIFGGFGMISSSSSTYWLSAAAAAAGDGDFDTTTSSRNGSSTARASTGTAAAIVRAGGGRSRSWGWAFASPMRAFRPATSSTSKSYATTTNGSISSINAAVAISNGRGSSNGKIINGGNDKVGANPAMLAVGG